MSFSFGPWDMSTFLSARLTHLFISSLLSPLSYLDFWAQEQTGVPDCSYFPAPRVVRQHLRHFFLSIYPKQLCYSNITTVHCMCMFLCPCKCVSFLGLRLGVRFHPDSRGSHGGGPNICSEGQEQKHWHVSLFTEMTFSPLPIPASLPAAVLLSASLPQAWLKPSARISPRLPKSPLTKCQDYIFLCSHWGL